ncbi:MAG: DUF3108 domain-containing protein [Candidatus Hydrogenedentota bacterium]|nr:MAG: DUF3108 domain-containing protein [Candidatus Hydrogenedentota bacterium]
MRIPSLSALPGCSTGCRVAVIVAVSALAALGFPRGPIAAGGASSASADPFQADFSHARRIPEGRYLYRFAWNGIPSAKSEVVVRVEKDGERPYYCFKGTARTSKFADIFWKFRAYAVAVVDVLSGRAIRIHIAEQQNTKFKETETVFNYESSEAYYTRWKKGKVKRERIRLEGNTIDPASLGLMLCQKPLVVGDSAAFVVLVGDDPYALTYTVTARERISAANGEFDALRVEPRFHKIEDENKRRPPKVRRMTLWLTASEPRIPLKMKSRTFVGHVTGELVQVLPSAAEAREESASAPRRKHQTDSIRS